MPIGSHPDRYQDLKFQILGVFCLFIHKGSVCPNQFVCQRVFCSCHCGCLGSEATNGKSFSVLPSFSTSVFK